MAREKIATGETVTKTSALKALRASRRFSQKATHVVEYGLNYALAEQYAQAAMTEAVVAAEIIRRLK